MGTAEPEEGLQQFLDDSVPVLDDQEMEDLYRHFLEDELPEEDDADEDFEPSPLEVDEEAEEEDEEAGVRRRNIQARELDDLLQDAYKQLGPSAVSPGLKERVLDQLSMHFQLLAQTSILAVKAESATPHQRDQVYRSALGMLEHLTFRSSDSSTARQGRRTRARWKTTSTCWDPEGEDLPAVGVPGLFPGSTLADNIKAASEDISKGDDIHQVVEGFMTCRGGVVWPQLLPTNVREGTDWPLLKRRQSQSPSCAQTDTQTWHLGEDRAKGLLTLADPSAFSMVEDRLLCRGIHLHGMEWDTIKDNFLPHKSTEALMQRYAVLSGWASVQNTTRGKHGSQAVTAPWTPEEDLKLKNAVQKYGKKWTHIAKDVLPSRGKEGLRSRWAMLESRMPTEDDRPRSGTPPDTVAAKAYGTAQKYDTVNSGDGRVGDSMALGSTLSAPLGLSLVAPPVAFGRLDSTAGHPSMLGVHGLWPPLGVNPLELSMRIPSLNMPVLPAANTAGPALVGGNVVYRTPHPLVATAASSRHSELETASASGMKRGVAGAHRSPATDKAMMSMYGIAGVGFPVPSGDCKRHTGGTKGQTITETDDGEADLACRLGAAGGRWNGSQSNAGIDLSGAPSEGVDRMVYAEDELSDDECSDGPGVSPRSSDRPRVDPTADGAAPPQKLYEEDELSDDDDSNHF